MPRFSELDEPFVCPYRHGCPCLEGLPPDMVWQRYQAVQGTECQYEHLLRELHGQLDQEQRRNRELETENQQLKVQLRALHQRQFKGRTHPPKDPPKPDAPDASKKPRGAPRGHPGWQRPVPDHVDRVVVVAMPCYGPQCRRRKRRFNAEVASCFPSGLRSERGHSAVSAASLALSMLLCRVPPSEVPSFRAGRAVFLGSTEPDEILQIPFRG